MILYAILSAFQQLHVDPTLVPAVFFVFHCFFLIYFFDEISLKIPLRINENQFKLPKNNVNDKKSMEINENYQKTMKINEKQWKWPKFTVFFFQRDTFKTTQLFHELLREIMSHMPCRCKIIIQIDCAQFYVMKINLNHTYQHVYESHMLFPRKYKN